MGSGCGKGIGGVVELVMLVVLVVLKFQVLLVASAPSIVLRDCACGMLMLRSSKFTTCIRLLDKKLSKLSITISTSATMRK